MLLITPVPEGLAVAVKMTSKRAREVSQDPDWFTVEECSTAAARLRASAGSGNATYSEVQYLRHQADAAQSSVNRRPAHAAT